MALTLNGTNQFANLGSPVPDLNGKPAATMMGWINLNSIPTGGNTMDFWGLSIASGGFTPTSRASTGITSSGQMFISGRDIDGGGAQFTTGTVVLSTGVWTHIVGIVNIPSDQHTYYVNGVFDKNDAVTYSNSTFPFTDSFNGVIGADDDGSGNYVDGIIDDTRLYDRVLSADEIKTIFAARGHDGIVGGLMRRYLFNESTGTVTGDTVDFSPFQRAGAYGNSPSFAPSQLSFSKRKQIT